MSIFVNGITEMEMLSNGNVPEGKGLSIIDVK